MELIKFEDYLKKSESRLVATIGDFDGIHLAHQLLITKTSQKALELNIKSAIITFDPHPATILSNHNVELINSSNEKYKICEKFGIDYLIVINFDLKFSTQTPKEFIENYLLKINVCELFVGFDFKFGKFGLGNVDDISSLSNNLIKTNKILEISYHGEKIGSTLIRKYIKSGLLEDANYLLTYPYFFSGEVIYGKQIGRTINLPTANIYCTDKKLLLKKGVYAVKILINGIKYYGMMNVGNNPSFNYTKNYSTEVNIFDFNQDIYGKIVTIECYKYIRDEIKFASVDLFLRQVLIDKQEICEYFKI